MQGLKGSLLSARTGAPAGPPPAAGGSAERGRAARDAARAGAARLRGASWGFRDYGPYG